MRVNHFFGRIIIVLMLVLCGGVTVPVMAAESNISVTEGADITKTLNKALQDARDTATDAAPVTITLPAGKYNISAALHIYSNTVLDLNGSVITFTGTNSNMIMTATNEFNTSDANKGYTGVKNIVIQNGTFVGSASCTSSMVKLQHATNVKLYGLTVTGGACKHQAEIAAIDGFYVTNCTFSDMKVDKVDGEKAKYEALQLDIPCATSVYPYAYEDGTPMRNVEITGCTFQNVPRGVGTHTLLTGAYHENIKISNNTFSDINEEAIVALGYVGCEIKNNKIERCGAGILCQMFKSTDDKSSIYTTIMDGKQSNVRTVIKNAKTEISGNTISIKYTSSTCEKQAIRVEGRVLDTDLTVADKTKVPAGDYRIAGVTVKNNTIVTAGSGIHMIGTEDCQVQDNKITGAEYYSKDANRTKYDGIFIEANAANVLVSGNTISNVPRDGIFIQNKSTVAGVVNNTINGCDGQGIHLFDSAGVTGGITNNQMTGCLGGGILASTKCSIDEISDNSMGDMIRKNNKSDGICIYMNSVVSGDIRNNIISKANGAGITVTTGSTVNGSIAKNTLDQIQKNGIFIYKNSSVKKDIADNKLSGVSLNGVMINDKANVLGGVTGNTLKKVSGKGIFVYDKSRKSYVGGGIVKNVISGVKKQGIDISSTKKPLGVTDNKITTGSAEGIIINVRNTDGLVTVQDNTITGNNKANAIRVVKGKALLGGNKIAKVKIGILINKAAKAEVLPNVYGKKVKKQLQIAGTFAKNTAKKITVKSLNAAKGQVKLNSTVIAQVNTYEVQYSTDPTFAGGVRKINLTCADRAKKVSASIKGLKKGKTYYVRISGYTIVKNKKVYYGFSKPKMVIVK